VPDGKAVPALSQEVPQPAAERSLPGARLDTDAAVADRLDQRQSIAWDAVRLTGESP